MQTFDARFSSYCDFVQFVTPRYLGPQPANVAYFITRGVELLGEVATADNGAARCQRLHPALRPPPR